MTQTAIIRGLAKWAKNNMAKQFSAGSLTRIGFDAITHLADTNPALAVQMALVKYPSLAPIVMTVKDAASFDATWSALAASIEDNGCLTVDVKEPFGRVHIFRIGKGDLDAMRGEMERAYKDELAAAKAVEQAGQSAGGAQ